MRRWTSFVLAVWVAIIAAQTGAWAMAITTVPEQGPARMSPMDCDCPSMDMSDRSEKSDDCSRDPGCMARCTFLQPAIVGPTVEVSLPVVAITAGWRAYEGVAQYRAAPPLRPPNPTIQS